MRADGRLWAFFSTGQFQGSHQPRRGPKRYSLPADAALELEAAISNSDLGELKMRELLAAIVLVAATVGMSACFHVHEQAVVVEPLK